jgi:GTPase SAR1 family protein
MLKIAVVGGCGSGKSTIVGELCSLGYDAYVVGQEHSAVAHLWSRQGPDVVVYLDVTLAAVRERRDRNWPEWLYEKQQERLRDARGAADVRVNTSVLTVDETVRKITEHLKNTHPDQSS